MSYSPVPLSTLVTEGLPSTWKPDTIYYVRLGDPGQSDPAASNYYRTEVFVTDGSGVPMPVGNTTVIDGRIASNLSLETSTPPEVTSGTTYYVDSAGGNDAAAGTALGTAWKTTAKLASVSFFPGDTVLFKRGGVYQDGFTVNQNAVANNPIQFSAYGSGAKPVISGLRTLTNWTSQGNNIWSCAIDAGTKLQTVLVDGVFREMGKWPTVGYNYMQSSTKTNGASGTSTGTLTDTALNGKNFVGAEIVIRKRDWVLDRCLVTAHSGSTVSWSSDDQHTIDPGNGYFIQNTLSVLSVFGDWYYNPTTKVLYMHMGAGGNPGTHVIKAAAPQTVIDIRNRNYITLDNLNIIGSNNFHVDMQDANYSRITNSLMSYCGGEFINGSYADYYRIENNTMEDCHNTGMRLLISAGISVRRNTIRRCGLMGGMGRNNNGQRMGFLAQELTDFSVIEDNVVENVGYCGIMWRGKDIVIRRNLVNGFCLTVSDGGGIYTWEERQSFNRKVYNNIVLNGLGQNVGTTHAKPHAACGFYNDDLCANVEYFGNVSAFNSDAGLYLHNASKMQLHDNLFYGNRAQILAVFDSNAVNPEGDGIDYPVREIHSYNNTLMTTTDEQILMELQSRVEDHNLMGVFENNVYGQPYGPTGRGIYVTVVNPSTNTYKKLPLGLNGWKLKYGKDAGTIQSPVNYPRDTVLTTSTGNLAYNQTFNDNSFVQVGGATTSLEPKITGSSLKVVTTTSDGSQVQVYFHFSGGLVAGQKYQVKFDFIAAPAQDGFGGTLLLIENGNAFADAANEYYYPEIKSTVQTVNCVFTASRTVAAAIAIFRYTDALVTSWYDNVDIRGVQATKNDPALVSRLEINTTDAPVVRSLPSPFVDPRNITYPSAVNVDRKTAAALILKP